ncbi:MAG TPA: uroporphyrinogen decarboxylase [Rhizomicrobium sp.]|jgi:uroporphyrinogen decarboxylase|nr:uroporphyrinogen decarboxylase [Rhizomicrobium sp.]
MVKKLLSVLQGEAASVPPIWLMRQAGRYLPEYRALRAKAPDFVQFCLNPELAAEVTLQPIRRYQFDAAILFADILLIPHALGQKLWFAEGEGPRLEPLRDGKDIAALHYEAAKLAPVMQTIRNVRAALDGNTALIGFAGAPWTVATYMIEGRGGTDHEAIRRWAWSEPESFARLMDVLVDSTSAYLIAQADAGAEALQLFESWAGTVPAGLFERAVLAPTARIIAAVKAKHPAIPIIGFPRGAGGWLSRYAEAAKVNGVGVDQMTDIASLALPSLIARQGNLDPILLLQGGTAMRAEAKRLVEVMLGKPFIFNLGHGVMQPTPPEHVADLVTAIRSA